MANEAGIQPESPFHVTRAADFPWLSDIDLKQLIENCPIGMFVADGRGRTVYANQAIKDLVEVSDEALLGEKWIQLIHPADREKTIRGWEEFLKSGGKDWKLETRVVKPDGDILVLELKVRAILTLAQAQQGFLGIVEDITTVRKNEELLLGQKEILEMIAMGSPMIETLKALTSMIEKLTPGALCSILLLRADDTVAHAAAPSLPQFYIDAVDGLKIGPKAGSCGTAAFKKEAVFVEDIATNPLWEDYKELAMRCSLRACWSTPIKDFSGRVLGTFAIYYRQPSLPKPIHLQIIEAATHTAAIGILHHEAHEQLRISEGRNQQLVDSNIIGVIVTSPSGVIHEANRAFLDMVGYSFRDLKEGRLRWPDLTPPEYAEADSRGLQQLKAHGFCTPFEKEYFRKDGSRVPIYIGAAELPGGKDELVCFVLDISETKRIQRERQQLMIRLWKSEDEERRRIARDLHDTTAQHLVAAKMNLLSLAGKGDDKGNGNGKLLSETRDLIEQSIQEIRTLTYLLHPPLLEELGLAGAIRDYSVGFSQRSGIHVDVDVSGYFGRLSKDKEVALFRVVQEALTNIHRHSGSQTAVIRLERDSEQVRIEVQDNGQGFPAEMRLDRMHSRGVGLAAMQERLASMGGSLEVESESNGVTLLAMIPAPTPQESEIKSGHALT